MLLEKKDMNLIMDSSIKDNEPRIYHCLKAAWDETSTGLKHEHLDRVIRKYPKEVQEIKNTAKFIKEKYVDAEWEANSYIPTNKAGKCERCGANLKHLFKIANKKNHKSKIVGVECLTRFSELDEEMNREAYNRLLLKRPDYETWKRELGVYFKNKRYPYPKSIIRTSENPYSQLIKAENKLRKFSFEAESLIIDIINKLDELIKLKLKLEKYHQENKNKNYYCDSEIYAEISEYPQKVKAIEANNSFITKVIADDLKSKTFIYRHKEKIERLLKIDNLNVHMNYITFKMQNLDFIAKSSEMYKIIHDIIFNDNYDRRKYQNIIIEFEKNSLYKNFDIVVGEFRKEQRLSTIDFDFVEDNVDYLIVRRNMYTIYKKEYFDNTKIVDVSTYTRLVEKLRIQLERIPKIEWFDKQKLNEMREFSSSMSETPGKNR